MKQYMTGFAFVLFCLATTKLCAQTDSSRTKPVVTLTGFVDAYYCFDFNHPETYQRQPFLYNHNRHREIYINLALIKLSVQHPKYRAVMALHAGTYSEDNY